MGDRLCVREARCKLSEGRQPFTNGKASLTASGELTEATVAPRVVRGTVALSTNAQHRTKGQRQGEPPNGACPRRRSLIQNFHFA